MAVDTFIPEVWAAKLKIALAPTYIFAQPGISNRDYEGEISQYGDTVHIGSLGAVAVDDYVKNVTVIDPDTLGTTDETLVIDQSKYFSFEVDDIDSRQVRDSGDLMGKAATLAARALAATADTFLSTKMTTGAGTIMTPGAVATADAAFLLMRKMAMAQDKKDVPRDSRFLAVSPEFYALIQGDNRFIDASRYGSTSPILNGEIGRALGYRIISNNHLPEGTVGAGEAVSNFVIAGHPMALTFAEQIAKTEAFRPQGSFSDAVKGLHLYGARVVRPEALVVQDTDVTVV